MSYFKWTDREGLDWNDVTEMMCLLIFKKLKEQGFLRGLQKSHCKKMASIPNIGLSEGSISAKVSNYKSVAGINKPSNASKNTERIYKENHKLSIKELEEKIQNRTN